MFGGRPPSVSDTRAWENVGSLVVGEEGPGTHRWRMPFSAITGQRETAMPDELLARNGGWYFLRVYDKNDHLLESFDFRFATGLYGITIAQLRGCA